MKEDIINLLVFQIATSDFVQKPNENLNKKKRVIATALVFIALYIILLAGFFIGKFHDL